MYYKFGTYSHQSRNFPRAVSILLHYKLMKQLGCCPFSTDREVMPGAQTREATLHLCPDPAPPTRHPCMVAPGPCHRIWGNGNTSFKGSGELDSG